MSDTQRIIFSFSALFIGSVLLGISGASVIEALGVYAIATACASYNQ